MSAPLYQLKAAFFKALGHPIRIRILELLVEGPRSVSELNEAVGIESSHLSQQLGVLKRAGLVDSAKSGSNVTYFLLHQEVSELLAIARRILTEVLTDSARLLADLAEPTTSAYGPSGAQS